jgi:phosphoribosylformimino-5-aminoimidazole carboxamide ribotide isomerase
LFVIVHSHTVLFGGGSRSRATSSKIIARSAERKPQNMRILPVLDLMNGVVVRGVGGRRDQYKPIASKLTTSVQPLDVAHAFRQHFSFDELYVADLDAIAGGEPSTSTYLHLLAEGFRLWVDAGIGPDGGHLNLLAAAGVTNLIAGLESLSGLDELSRLLACYSPSRLIFSLDLKNGEPMGEDGWCGRDPWCIAEQVIALGVERILALDLASVGSSRGTATEGLCARLRTSFPTLEITAGGGIRGADDLRSLQRIGVDNVLIASALHDGRLQRVDTTIYP